MLKILIIIGIAELAFVVLRMIGASLEYLFDGKPWVAFANTIETAIVIFVLIKFMGAYFSTV